MKVNSSNNISSLLKKSGLKKPIPTTLNDATIEIIIMPIVAGNFKNLKLM